MKFLFLLTVGLCLWWAWKRSTQAHARQPAPEESATPTVPQDMVACRHCGVHLPQGEAVAGTLGPYCSVAHRSAAGDRNPI